VLQQIHETLPASWYFDPAQFHREMEAIWWRDWLCVGRCSEWPEAGDYRIIRVGDQQVVITRTGSGELHAFHNTCRHRGSLICQAEAGHFNGQRIVCPYHAWTYSLEGDLLRTPRKPETPDFRIEDYSLYPVELDTWGGFVFINLSENPATTLQQSFGVESARLANWPLDELLLAHREIHSVGCNWKIFWENYLECYHCPNIHHDLCRLVPLYGAGVVSADDLPADSPLRRPAGESRLAQGAVTWSHDGQTGLPWFEGLSPAEQVAGMTFADLLPAVFIVAHVDYVRSVHIMPLGPEQTRVTVNWLLPQDVLDSGRVDTAALSAFGNQVVLEDARVCELNQMGLHSLRHRHGVLAPQEYDILAFNQWVLDRLGSVA